MTTRDPRADRRAQLQSATSADDPLAAFNRCQTAEEYFALLDVAYDPRVVSVNRLHILRHFAGQLAEIHRHRTEPESPGHALDTYRDALTRSYQAFTTATALDHRLFKVLRDRAPRAFVPTAAVAVQHEAREQ